MTEHSRLDTLEQSVARLTKEVVALRGEVRRLRASGGATPVTETDERTVLPEVPPSAPGDSEQAQHALPLPPSSSRRAPPPPGKPFIDARWAASLGDSLDPGTQGTAARGDLEALVGRYGTLALAALTILMGVGAFLGWAIRQGLIGPELRIAAGAAAALAVAAAGWRLRRGNSRPFGNILLALSLAIGHVVCWGAGPLLGLVPLALALALACAASAALAILAFREGEQALFNVGFGGAFLAPFVTSSGDGDPILLLTYGALVGAAGMRALANRDWSRTPFVLSLGIVVYTAAAINQLSTVVEWSRATAPVVYALVNAWLALLLIRGTLRPTVAFVALLSALGALVALTDASVTAGPRYVLAAVLTVTALLVAPRGDRGVRSALLGALLLPVGGLAVALSTLADATSTAGALTALGWAVASALAAWRERDDQRSAHAFTATATGGLVLVLAVHERNVPLAVALAAYGALASVAMLRLRLAGIGTAVFGWLAVGAVVAFSLLGDRTPYTYTPLLAPESLAGAATSAAWLLFSWCAAKAALPGTTLSRQLPKTLIRLLGAIVPFLWIREELAHAVSDDVSTFLLIAYYAVVGMLAIWAGRRWLVSVLRQVGLALAVFAAIKAIAQASSLTIGLRIAGYMLAGCFLLAVAYWYRAPGRGVGEGEETAPGPA